MRLSITYISSLKALDLPVGMASVSKKEKRGGCDTLWTPRWGTSLRKTGSLYAIRDYRVKRSMAFNGSSWTATFEKYENIPPLPSKKRCYFRNREKIASTSLTDLPYPGKYVSTKVHLPPRLKGSAAQKEFRLHVLTMTQDCSNSQFGPICTCSGELGRAVRFLTILFSSSSPRQHTRVA